MRCKPLAYAFIALSFLAGCKNAPEASSASTTTTGGGTAASGGKPTPGALADLKTDDLKPGKGKAAAKGDTLWVLYTGTLPNGTKFDSTADHGNQPFQVEVGAGQVIKGWDEGLVGMKVGGERKLSIPWKLAYGEMGNEKIPPKTDLFFDVTAVALVKQGEEDLVSVESQTPGTGPEVADGDTITIDYTISLPGGDVADKRKDVKVIVGKTIAIPGLDSGVVGMKEGGKRRLMIPPKAGIPYGKGKIPAQSVIYIDVQVKKVQKGKKA